MAGFPSQKCVTKLNYLQLADTSTMKRNVCSRPFVLTVLFCLSFLGCHKSGENARDSQHKQEVASNPIDLGEFTSKTTRKEKRIDMTQFKKTALDIPYAGTQNPRQTLDIIYPSRGVAPYKTIVLFHGGGWMAGDKRSEAVAPVFQATDQGYAVVSVNYRLSDEVKWPKPLHDAKAAIRFLRANAGKYQLDAKNLVVWGASAGGHIAEMLAATNHKPSFEDLTMGSKDSSSAVQGVVSWCAVHDVSALTDAGTPPANKIMGFDVRTNRTKTHNANPIELVTPRFPPILLVHGTGDQVVPYQQSVDMQRKVNEVTRKPTARLITFEGAIHGDPVIKTNRNVHENLDFVDRILYPEGRNPYRHAGHLEIKLLE